MKETPMYQRFVCFKFNELTSYQEIQTHLDMFASLPNHIPEMMSYAGGRSFLGGEGVGNYDTAHYITFKSREDIDQYFHHPAHQAFIDANKGHWQDVLVVDSEILTC